MTGTDPRPESAGSCVATTSLGRRAQAAAVTEPDPRPASVERVRIISLVAILAVANSKRLRRGAMGALMGVLVVPFALLVIVAGVCVASTNGLLQ